MLFHKQVHKNRRQKTPWVVTRWSYLFSTIHLLWQVVKCGALDSCPLSLLLILLSYGTRLVNRVALTRLRQSVEKAKRTNKLRPRRVCCIRKESLTFRSKNRSSVSKQPSCIQQVHMFCVIKLPVRGSDAHKYQKESKMTG